MLKIQLCIMEINYILKYINMEDSYLKLIIFHSITAFTVIFDQINAALMIIRDFFQKHKNLWTVVYFLHHTLYLFLGVSEICYSTRLSVQQSLGLLILISGSEFLVFQL